MGLGCRVCRVRLGGKASFVAKEKRASKAGHGNERLIGGVPLGCYKRVRTRQRQLSQGMRRGWEGRKWYYRAWGS